MSKILIGELEELFPDHEIRHSWNESGYSDVELIIDDCWSGIWTDDFILYSFDDDQRYQSHLQHLKQEIEQYLKLK